jgi:hypothetical protein
MRLWYNALATCVLAFWLIGTTHAAAVAGELKLWHTVTLTFDGPASGEDATPNPFADYRLDVTFTHASGRKITVPGYFAADGDAANTSATAGNKWRAHFTPDEVGQWTYAAVMRVGVGVAVVRDDPGPAALAVALFDGATGSFTIAPTDKTAPDFRAKGMLRYVGQHYLQFAATGEYFIKAGADSPENLLAYEDFDGTEDHPQAIREGEAVTEKLFLHRYQPHLNDWKANDPAWRGGKGKALIGGMNYLASKGVNSVYFLTMNVNGDGREVYPWTTYNKDFTRFDCSKLDQWEIVFAHMQKLGLQLHLLLQETENDKLLNNGDLGLERKLYYRELIARFAHHPALEWNLGEESKRNETQHKADSTYIKALDPYDHPVVVHTFPGQYDKVYAPLLGHQDLDGPSLQIGNMKQTHAETLKWVDRSAAAGHKWMVCLDEIGPADTGVKPDADDPEHNDVRHHALWGNLMAGGAGVEWYFGYKFAHNDLNCEDWRSREKMWDQTRYAVEFFQQHLPFTTLTHHDELTTAADDYCLANPGQVYAIYLPKGGSTNLDLGQSTATFTIHWYNPRVGGVLQQTAVTRVPGPGPIDLGPPPADGDKDWVALVRRSK